MKTMRTNLLLMSLCALAIPYLLPITTANAGKKPTWRAPSADASGGQKRLMSVTMMIKLKHKNSIRTRRSSFQMRGRSRTKTIQMKNGAVWLNLVVSMKTPREIGAKGALKLKSFFAPIEIKPTQIDPNKPWTMVVKSKLKNASATIEIKAAMVSSVKRGKANNYKLLFKGVSLQRVLVRVAEFNNLKLAMQPNVPKIKRIKKLALAAPKRKQLIDMICKRFGLQCHVQSGVLWVKRAAAPAKRK